MSVEGSQRPSKITDEALLAAVPTAANMRQLLLALGVAAYGGNYEVVRARLRALGIQDLKFQPRGRRRPPVKVSPEEVRRWVPLVESYAQLARLLGLGDSSRAQVRAKALALASGVDLSHFSGQGWSRGVKRGRRPRQPLEDVLVAGTRVTTSNLRERLIDEGVLERVCAGCDRAIWEALPIPLELDHINGDRTDNRLENLRLLCPNCHAQTPTYRGRNIGGPSEEPSAVEDRAALRRSSSRSRAERRLVLVLQGCPTYGGRDRPP